jgi:predicted ATPase
VVRWLSREPLEVKKPVTIFLGENGTGKSTLIEAIAVSLGFNPEGGTKNFLFSTRESHSSLHRSLRIHGTRFRDGFFLRAESFYNLATNIEELDKIPACSRKIIESYGGVSLHHQSHGESFMALVENRFGGDGLYLLDEPEAALSPMRQMELLCHIQRLVQKNSQFIISTHSPLLMAYPDADLYQITSEGVQKVTLRETEHYQVMKSFLDNPERMLHFLFAENEL